MSSVSLVFASGRQLEIVTPSRRYLYWVAIWNPSVLTELLQLASHNGVPTQTDWTPGSRGVDPNTGSAHAALIPADEIATELNVVIDAITGEHLESFSYR
jgi:hypothetical protein